MSSHRTAIRNGERVSITEVPSGKNEWRLFCGGMCGENVIAKKGKFKEHHFAHGPNSNCAYYDNAKGGGGKGQNHQDAQENFIKLYEDPDVKSIFVNYHPPCLNGPNCGEVIKIDIKKEFPSSENCMEIEYKHKTDTRNCSLDVAILPRRVGNNIPRFAIEIIDKHKTKECEREGLGCEWVSISADTVNRFYESNKKTLDGLKTAHCGDIDIIAEFNCIREKFIGKRCELCHKESEELRIASEKIRCARLQQKERYEAERQYREAERKLQQQRDEAEQKLRQERDEAERKLQQEHDHAEREAERQEREAKYEEERKQREAEYEAVRQRHEAARQLQEEKQLHDAIILANIREKDKRKMHMLDNIASERKSRLKDTFDILKSPIETRKIAWENIFDEIIETIPKTVPHKKTYKNNKKVKCERCSKMGSSICYHKTPMIREQIEYEEGEEHDELDNKKNKIYYCSNCFEIIEHFKKEGRGSKAYNY